MSDAADSVAFPVALAHFTLPGEITDYVLSVTFDESGDIAGMTMES
jgi:hypothetical protein